MLATGLCVLRFLDGTQWVYALGLILVGHGTQDVVNQIRK